MRPTAEVGPDKYGRADDGRDEDGRGGGQGQERAAKVARCQTKGDSLGEERYCTSAKREDCEQHGNRLVAREGPRGGNDGWHRRNLGFVHRENGLGSRNRSPASTKNDRCKK